MATYDAASARANCFDGTTRTPWNNVIYPGNYVCRLNSYRNQGVNAYPGLEFFSLVGALVVLPIQNTQSNVLNSSAQLPAATYALQILSPDLGPSPKPLVNRNFVVPSGAGIYGSAVSTVNLEEATATGNTTITVDGIAAQVDSEDLRAVLTADSNGTFNECGARAVVLNFQAVEVAATSSNTSVTVTTSAALKPVNVSSGGSGSAFSDPTAGQSAIIVEVDYFMVAKGPDSDSVNLPFPYTSESSEV
jgi:hypothetical protein